jgi:tRNA A-37 threonylcarbamoyl transferase component Bud32
MSKENRWRVLPGTDPAAAERFADLDCIFALEGEVVAKDSMTRTQRVEINGRNYYVKRYAGLGKKPLRRWFAKPRVQSEWENLGHFAGWGIPTARLVAFGLEQRGSRFRRGALITEEIPGTTDLRRIVRNQDPRLKSRRWRDGVMRQLAAIVRCLHDHRFAHGDLKWRNILIDRVDRVFLIDSPSGDFWHPPFLEYRIIKDLACLDKFARRSLSRTDRLRFYLHYAGKPKLDGIDRKRLRKILAFFAGRDEDLASAASLRSAGRVPLPRQHIALADGSLLYLERWLRILPGKRLTAIGEWRGRKVLAKLFVAERNALRHWQRECDGLHALQAANIATPSLLASGTLEEGGHYVLTEFLHDARPPVVIDPATLTPAFRQLGLLHRTGLLQEDAHLDNFLLRNDAVLVVDGAAIRPLHGEDDRLANLALLFAQLPAGIYPDQQDALLSAYICGAGKPTAHSAQLAALIRQTQQHRLSDYLDKCLRDCTLFKSARRTDRFFSMVRAEAKMLVPLMQDPDAWIETGTLLKRGSTSTLARISVDGRALVIKRYNIKGPGHALSRCWRPSRAWHAWVAGHRLDFLGIATPHPLVLVERRFGPLRGKAWLVTEYCPGERLWNFLERHLDAPPEDALAAIQQLFTRLATLRITHGDLKAANLLWHEGKLSLVDLDDLQQHDSDAAFQRAWRKDRARLLRNWPTASTLYARLNAILPPA